MNDYTAMKLHRMRTEELEREALIREALEMPVTDHQNQQEALARIVGLVVRRRKPQTRTPEVEFSPRTAAVQCAEWSLRV